VIDPNDSSRWLPTDAHREAAARCLHLIEQQAGCAVICGDAGCGKTLVLRRLVRRAARLTHRACYIDLQGLDAAEFQWRLCAGLRLAPNNQDSRATLWTRITDALDGASSGRLSAAVIFDHLEAATPETLAELRRWLQLAQDQKRTATIIGARSPLSESQSRLLADFCDLRSDIQKLTAQQTSEFISRWTEADVVPMTLFEPDAVASLHHLTDGEPRKLERLCRLARLASAAERGKPLSSAALQALAEELTINRRTA
jgi:type II secretory pathway predicted ATPase ExeA